MKILLIQTAFIGDVILATALLEVLHKQQPQAELHFLLQKGNESLFVGHPYLKKTWVFDKKRNKIAHLYQLGKTLRAEGFSTVINLHRFLSSGILSYLTGAPCRIGFDKNPFSWSYTQVVKHTFEPNTHEIDRNLSLLASLFKKPIERTLPKLYPTPTDLETATSTCQKPYVTISPASIWFTKQYPLAKWQQLIGNLPSNFKVYLLGGKADAELCNKLVESDKLGRSYSLAGSMSLLQSAAIMNKAQMNYVNDSAPMHLASSQGAPVSVMYCSTVPSFGFGPLSPESHIFESAEPLTCRPCGLHGRATCPQGHFKCSEIDPVFIIERSLIKSSKS
jgi:heptosyltransferase-2